MARRLRIGLTGGIASGKSTAAGRFRELGIPVIDADESSRLVVAKGQPGLKAVVAKFGEDVLTADGELDRRALRGVAVEPVEDARDVVAPELALHAELRGPRAPDIIRKPRRGRSLSHNGQRGHFGQGDVMKSIRIRCKSAMRLIQLYFTQSSASLLSFAR
jgi:hypothetical protein